jgi:hypothetical protein
VLGFGFDYSAGDHGQGAIGAEADDAGVCGSQGKEAERQAGGGEFDDALIVAQESGRMAVVDVADSAQLFVVAASEGGATADASGGAHDLKIETAGEFDHGFGFVDLIVGKDLLASGAEAGLRGLDDGLAGLAFAGDVEQSEEKAVGADAAEVVEIASVAGKIGDGQVGALERGAIGLDDFGSFRGSRTETEFGQETRHEAVKLAYILRRSNEWKVPVFLQFLFTTEARRHGGSSSASESFPATLMGPTGANCRARQKAGPSLRSG